MSRGETKTVVHEAEIKRAALPIPGSLARQVNKKIVIRYMRLCQVRPIKRAERHESGRKLIVDIEFGATEPRWCEYGLVEAFHGDEMAVITGALVYDRSSSRTERLVELLAHSEKRLAQRGVKRVYALRLLIPETTLKESGYKPYSGTLLFKELREGDQRDLSYIV